MAQLAQAQFTLTDDTDIVISIEPPENATKDMLWLSVGSSPILLYRWSGIQGKINNVDINSKTNYFYEDLDHNTSVQLEITNPQQNFSIYNLYSSSQIFTAAGAWTMVVNELNHYTESTILDYAQAYAAFQCTNLTNIKFNIYSCSLWCPVIDETTNFVVQSLQEQLLAIIQNLNELNITILKSPNGLELIRGLNDTTCKLFQTYALKKLSSNLILTTK